MITHIWSVLCQRSLIDLETNNISIIDVFEELLVNVSQTLKTKELPVSELSVMNVSIPYEIVSLWLRDRSDVNEKINIKIVLIDPKKKEIQTIDQPMELKAGSIRYRTRVKINGIAITIPGHYTVQVKIKEENKDNYRLIAELPLEVKITKNISSPILKN